MFCNKCGQELAPDSEFCHKCGASVVFKDVDKKDNTKNESCKAVDNQDEKQRKITKKGKGKKVFLSILLSIVSLALVAVIVVTVVIPQIDYSIACNHLENKDYASAITMFESLGDYKDSADKLLETKYAKASNYLENKQYKDAYLGFREIIKYSDSKVKVETAKDGMMGIIKKAKKGDVVSFGFYNNAPIAWYVLEKEKDQVLLFSCDSIGKHSFNDYLSSATWENCTLRSWLNKDFFGTAFGANEQKCIVFQKLSNSICSDTTDKVFLLSKTELEKFCTEEMAYGNGLGDQFFLRDCCSYFVWDKEFKVRSDSKSQNEDLAIRPAIWVDISKIK